MSIFDFSLTEVLCPLLYRNANLQTTANDYGFLLSTYEIRLSRSIVETWRESPAVLSALDYRRAVA